MSDRYAYSGGYWCAHCGQVTDLAIWESYGGACRDCYPIRGNDRHLEGRLWLAEWQTAVRDLAGKRGATG